MHKTNEADNQYTKELIGVVSDFGLYEDDHVVQLAALLRCHGFVVEKIDKGGEDAGRSWQRGPWSGPCLWLWSQSGRKLLDEQISEEATEDEVHVRVQNDMTTDNLRDRLRILELLSEFYGHKQHSTPIDLRLVVVDMAAGSSLLKCQGADIIALPEYGARRQEWLVRAENEMHYFAKFLFEKLDASIIEGKSK